MISIHALQAECDHSPHTHGNVPRLFLSTHSKRSATTDVLSKVLEPKFLSTHSKRSATLSCRWSISQEQISIHALQAECDKKHPDSNFCQGLFLSTHSKRSATIYSNSITSLLVFLSTHSKRSATVIPSLCLPNI